MNSNFPRLQTQRGAALFVSLVALLVMTLIGVTAATSSGLEMVIATNTQNAVQTLALAEDAVLAAETDILNNHNAGSGPGFDFDLDTTDGYYSADDVDLSGVAWDSIGRQTIVGADGNVIGEYVIEYLGTTAGAGSSLALGAGASGNRRYLFRATGRATANRGTTRLVQTIFAAQ